MSEFMDNLKGGIEELGAVKQRMGDSYMELALNNGPLMIRVLGSVMVGLAALNFSRGESLDEVAIFGAAGAAMLMVPLKSPDELRAMSHPTPPPLEQ